MIFSKKDTAIFSMYLQLGYFNDLPLDSSSFLQNLDGFRKKVDAARIRNIYFNKWLSEQSDKNEMISNTPDCDFAPVFKPCNIYEIGYESIIQFSDLGIANRNIVVKDNDKVNPNLINLYRILFSDKVTRHPIKNILVVGICADTLILEDFKNYKLIYPEVNIYFVTDAFLCTDVKSLAESDENLVLSKNIIFD